MIPKKDDKMLHKKLNADAHRRIRKTKNCWKWIGSVNVYGYGRLTKRKNKILKTFMAHRLIFEMYEGKIPKGLTLDHLCRNRACVNPKHLEPVTIKVNILRGESPTAKNARKTHCPRGHKYDYLNRSKNGRECLTCRHSDWKKYYRINREKVLSQRRHLK